MANKTTAGFLVEKQPLLLGKHQKVHTLLVTVEEQRIEIEVSIGIINEEELSVSYVEDVGSDPADNELYSAAYQLLTWACSGRHVSTDTNLTAQTTLNQMVCRSKKTTTFSESIVVEID